MGGYTYAKTWNKGPDAANKPNVTYSRRFMIDKTVEALKDKYDERKIRYVLSFVDFSLKHIMDHTKATVIKVPEFGRFFIPPTYLYIHHYLYKNLYFKTLTRLSNTRLRIYDTRLKLLKLFYSLTDELLSPKERDDIWDDIWATAGELHEATKALREVTKTAKTMKRKMDKYMDLYIDILTYIRLIKLNALRPGQSTVHKNESSLYNSKAIRSRRRQATKAQLSYESLIKVNKALIKDIKKEYYRLLNHYKKVCHETKREDETQTEVIEIKAFRSNPFDS